MSTDRLATKWEAGGSAIGAWCCMGSAFAAELCAAEDFDYICVDLQHGLAHFDGLGQMLTAVASSKADPIVRVPANLPHYMGQALDAGAVGVIVPMVNTREDAERAVSGCRYAPEGTRSFGPIRSGLFTSGPPAAVNRQAQCLVMIETLGAVERADEICSTAGVNGVYIGPADLAITMGLSPGFDEMPAEHADAIEHVRRTCESNKIVAGIHTSGGDQARRYLEAGFRMVTLSTDSALLRGAHRAELARARGLGSAGVNGYS